MDFKGGFRELDAWKESRKLRILISRIAKMFPQDERYSLTRQVIRSARSVTANIAEGYGRFYFKETIQFFRQARGSLFETIDHLIAALDEEYISKAVFDEAESQALKAMQLINGYIRYLEKSKKSDNS